MCVYVISQAEMKKLRINYDLRWKQWERKITGRRLMKQQQQGATKRKNQGLTAAANVLFKERQEGMKKNFASCRQISRNYYGCDGGLRNITFHGCLWFHSSRIYGSYPWGLLGPSSPNISVPFQFIFIWQVLLCFIYAILYLSLSEYLGFYFWNHPARILLFRRLSFQGYWKRFIFRISSVWLLIKK